jgi:hypothetical protein
MMEGEAAPEPGARKGEKKGDCSQRSQSRCNSIPQGPFGIERQEGAGLFSLTTTLLTISSSKLLLPVRRVLDSTSELLHGRVAAFSVSVRLPLRSHTI